MSKSRRRNNKWKYKNIFFTILGILVAIFLSRNPYLHNFLVQLGDLGYIGAFFAGMLFVSTFSVATGALILFILAESLHPLEIGLIAGVGGVIGDLMIYAIVKDGLKRELVDVYNHIDSDHHILKLFHSKYFSWTLPVIGAIIIASPLPDEFGVSLMGISKIHPLKFMLISYSLNSIGIFLTVSTALVVL